MARALLILPSPLEGEGQGGGYAAAHISSAAACPVSSMCSIRASVRGLADQRA